MSSNAIKQAAVTQFALEGYEGASLRKIAEEVGIKKPSIYAHYENKEDLFLRVVEYVFQLERRRVLSYFQEQINKKQPLEQILRHFFDWFQDEFETQDATKLLMRASYFPPVALYDKVMEIVQPFFDGLEKQLAKFFATHQYDDPQSLAISYMSIVDGFTIELVYGGINRYKKRVEAAWPVFWQGVQFYHQRS